MATFGFSERELEIAKELSEAKLLPNGEWEYSFGGTTGYTRKPHHILEDWCHYHEGATCCICGTEVYGVPSEYVPEKGFYCDSCM